MTRTSKKDALRQTKIDRLRQTARWRLKKSRFKCLKKQQVDVLAHEKATHIPCRWWHNPWCVKISLSLLHRPHCRKPPSPTPTGPRSPPPRRRCPSHLWSSSSSPFSPLLCDALLTSRETLHIPPSLPPAPTVPSHEPHHFIPPPMIPYSPTPHEAVRRPDLIELETLYEDHGPGMFESLNPEGRTPLLVAALLGYVFVTVWLLNQGARVTTQQNKGRETAVLLACYFCRMSTVRLLLKERASLNHRYNCVTSPAKKQMTLLMVVAGRGSLPLIKLLLQQYRKRHGQPALFAFIRAQNAYGLTALHWAAERGHVSLLWPLLQAGSDVIQCNIKGQTAFDECGQGSSGRACAEVLRMAMWVAVEEMERVKLLTKARAASDKAHRVASSLRLAHLLRKAEGVGIMRRKGRTRRGFREG